MSQQSFIWRGTAQAVTLHDAAGEVVWEGSLVPGREVPGLPVAHPHVATWIGGHLLEPVAEATPTEDAPTDVPTETTTRRRAAKEG